MKLYLKFPYKLDTEIYIPSEKKSTALNVLIRKGLDITNGGFIAVSERNVLLSFALKSEAEEFEKIIDMYLKISSDIQDLPQ